MKKPIIKDLIFTLVIFISMIAIQIPLLSMILAAITVVIYASINEQRFIAVGFKKPVSWLTSFIQSLFLATVIALVVIYFVQPAIEYLSLVPIDLTTHNSLIGNPRLLLLYTTIGGVAVGGVSEELIFPDHPSRKTSFSSSKS